MESERALIYRDLGDDLLHCTAAEIWNEAITALSERSQQQAQRQDGRDDEIEMTAGMIVAAVRYAVGRHTYIAGTISEQVVRLAPRFNLALRAAVVEAISEGVARSAADHSVIADWGLALNALRAQPLNVAAHRRF
jgi:hypothetical protein